MSYYKQVNDLIDLIDKWINENKMKQIKNIVLVFSLALMLYACQGPGVNNPGREYMPDMAHSIAVEANTHNYYFANTWDDESVLPLEVTSVAKEPVKGTIPRYSVRRTEVFDPNYVLPSGSVPYHYEDSEEGRALATAEIIENPFPITDKGLERGKQLYITFCATCHGSAGKNGDGIYASGIYPLAPANLVGDSAVVYSSPGRYYHAIMYGKNAMGAYKGKMSYEERWQVLHYIRALQAKEYEAEYNEVENTLNDYGIPYREWQAMRGEVDESEDNRLADEEATGESIRGRLIGNYEEAPPGEAKGDSG
ncbi:MAG: cytochrome c, partial [Bacteroidota bacterium]